MAGAQDIELLEQTPRLLETGDEAEQEPPVSSRSHRGHWAGAVCVAGSLALLGRNAYNGQGVTTGALGDIMVKDVARSVCTDNEFKDSVGDTCADWYLDEDQCKTADQWANKDGVSGETECCKCGGGTKGGGNGGGDQDKCTDNTNSVTKKPWEDKIGDNCKDYENNDWCGIASDWPDKHGVDATSACCKCGGGSFGGNGGGAPTTPPNGGGNGGGGAQCGVKGSASRRLGGWSTLRNAHKLSAKGGLSAKIVNGHNAESCEWKWQIGLRSAGSKTPWCGAQLIREDWVLTAAHCVDNGDTTFELVAGKFETDSDNDNVQTSLVQKVIIHPQYDKVSMNMDLALIKLKSPFTLNDCVGAICLPEQGKDVPPGTKCWISGWGTTESGGTQPAKLQEAEVEIHPQHDCNSKNNHAIMPSMICAQGRNPDGKITDGCQGDSGGPLVCEVQGKWILFGATSWGFGCADEAKPGVWARVHEALDWIASTQEANA